MIRLATTILGLVMLLLAIVSFVKAMKVPELPGRVTAFFLLVIASVLFVLVIADTYETWWLLFQVVYSELKPTWPVVYPGTAHVWGIWSHPLSCLLTLDVLCVATIVGIILRRSIPTLLSRSS